MPVLRGGNLEALAHQFGIQLTGSAAAKLLRQPSGGRIGDGHGLVLRLEVVPKPGDRGLPMKEGATNVATLERRGG